MTKPTCHHPKSRLFTFAVYFSISNNGGLVIKDGAATRCLKCNKLVKDDAREALHQMLFGKDGEV